MTVLGSLFLFSLPTVFCDIFNLVLTGDFAEKQFRDVGIVADDNHDRRRFVLSIRCLLDVFKALFPLAGEGVERVLGFTIDGFRFGFLPPARQSICR